jgi:hypothetical protein
LREGDNDPCPTDKLYRLQLVQIGRKTISHCRRLEL